MRKAIVLVNLGTPDSYEPPDVKRYLLEFLTDPRIIDTSWLFRQFLVRAVIVPRKYKESAECYERIWMKEGSPLKVYSQGMVDFLKKYFESKEKGASKHSLCHEKDFLDKDTVQVELAMRYANPSIAQALEKVKNCDELLILPLFPHYASATTGSVYAKVMEILSTWQRIPKLRFIHSFPREKKMIMAFKDLAERAQYRDYEHILFSFHGLPVGQLKKASVASYCQAKKDCCKTLCSDNQLCYSAQCYSTAQAIAQSLGLDQRQYSVCFQSRLGKQKWIEPYFSDTLDQLVKENKRKVLVFSPSFVCDCIETLHEISIEYQEEFVEKGGHELKLVPGLNTHPLWLEALVDISQRELFPQEKEEESSVDEELLRELQDLAKV